MGCWVFYVPSYSNPETNAPLWRDYASWIPDHMDSTISGEGGYGTDGILAFPYASSNAVPGLAPLIRMFNGSDHATTQSNGGNCAPYASSCWSLNSAGYWGDIAFPFWGFPRFGWASNAPTTLSGGEVTISSNAVAGGAIFSWQWNGAEFIDSPTNDANADFGREMQSALFNYTVPNPTVAQIQNPTEAGSHWAGSLYSSNGYYSQDWQGSPIVTPRKRRPDADDSRNSVRVRPGKLVRRRVPTDRVRRCRIGQADYA